MRIALVGVSQETDTFNPMISQLDGFRVHSLKFGDELVEKTQDKDTLNGILDLFSSKPDVELCPLFWAKDVAGGRLSREAYEYFEDQLVTRLAQVLPLDGIIFSLHGANSAEHTDDVGGMLLEAARNTAGDQVPIAVPMDHHAVITDRIMRHATIIDAHESQPHDLYHTGMKAAASLYRIITEDITPSAAYVKIPMIAPQDQFLTSHGAMKQWFDHARELEQKPGVLSVSLFPMQPWVDVEEGGWAVTVYTNQDPQSASEIAEELAREVWELRDQFWISQRLSVEEGIRAAVNEPSGLVIISDTGDAVYGGGTGDSTCLLKEMIRQEIPCRAFIPIVDPEAVQAAVSNGLGRISLKVGAVYDPFSTPAEITGTVQAFSRGLTAMTDRGVVHLGPAAHIEIGNISLVILSERNYTINMPILYTHLGLAMEDAKMVVCKTGSNFQYFSPWRSSLVRIDTPGVTQSDLTKLSWDRIPRPMYPLDEITSWEPKVINLG